MVTACSLQAVAAVGPLQLDLLKDWMAETHRPSRQPVAH